MSDYANINPGMPSIQKMPLHSEKPVNQEENNSNAQVTNEVKQEKTQINEREMFAFMANGAVLSHLNVKLSPAALIARWNTPEQVKNIELNMNNMDAEVDNKGMAILDAELAGVPEYENMSVANKRTLALAYLMNENNVSGAIGQMFDGVTDSVIEGLAGY